MVNSEGFALINRVYKRTGVDWNMAEFFIASKFQGKGAGIQAANEIFDQFRGTWTVMQEPLNKPATEFWRHAITNRYRKNSYTETVELIENIDDESAARPMNILQFTTTSLRPSC